MYTVSPILKNLLDRESSNQMGMYILDKQKAKKTGMLQIQSEKFLNIRMNPSTQLSLVVLVEGDVVYLQLH